jgi:SAM-dependent MidA family methyltransferase
VPSLKNRILDEIDREGPIDCARLMDLALYDEAEGYYMADKRAGREWLTAPTLSGVFGATLARLVAPAIETVDEPQLVEPGTGGGELTRDLALALAEASPEAFARLDLVPVDTSPTARQRASKTIQDAGIALDDVYLRGRLPDRVRGAIVANELLDAIPTRVAQHTTQGVAEIKITRGDPTLAPTLAEPSKPVLDRARKFQDALEPGLRFEVAQNAREWYREAVRRLEEGAIVTIDYGARRRDLLDAYPKGTIHAYREGRRVDEFWHDPGRMDLTYRVPFDEIQQVGEDEGLTTIAYGPQGRVLDELGIREVATRGGGQAKLAAKKLVDPDGAGNTFRVLVQARNVDPAAFPGDLTRAGQHS